MIVGHPLACLLAPDLAIAMAAIMPMCSYFSVGPAREYIVAALVALSCHLLESTLIGDKSSDGGRWPRYFLPIMMVGLYYGYGRTPDDDRIRTAGLWDPGPVMMMDINPTRL